MDQIPATYSTIENSFKEKNIINFKSNVKDSSRNIFYIYKYFQLLLQTWCGARIYFLDSQY